MNVLYLLWDILYPFLAILASFLVLAYRWERTPWVKRGVDRLLRRLSSEQDLEWLRPAVIALPVAVLFLVIAVVDDVAGYFSCGTGVDDTLGLVASGQAFLHGSSPFLVTSCGALDQVPYGLTAVLLDSLGSLGGPIGMWVVLDLTSLLFLPLVWSLGGNDRRYLTVATATSLLFVPIVSGQIDGASCALEPLAVLGALWLAATSPRWGAALGGFLATARFPSLFPVAGSVGRKGWDRWIAPAFAFGAFAAGTGVLYAAYGRAFLTIVFFGEFSRVSIGFNGFGLLFLLGWNPPEPALSIAQAAATLLLMEEVWRRRFPPLLAASVVIVGEALLTQFLSYDILISLVPIVLIGTSAQRQLFWVGVVGLLDYQFGYNLMYTVYGVSWPMGLLDLVLTAVLLLLFVDLWRMASRREGPGGNALAAPLYGAISTPAPLEA